MLLQWLHGAFAFVLVAFPAAAIAQQPGCPAHDAPLHGQFMRMGAADADRPGNQGLHVSGFVNIPGEVVVHGFDVSKYQPDVDFARAKACGAGFAYVRLSGGEMPSNEEAYRFHWRDARYVNLLVGPYHNLAIHDAATPASNLSNIAFSKLEADNIDYASRQAELFAVRLTEMLAKDVLPQMPGPRKAVSRPYLPIGIDASWHPQATRSAADKLRFGRIYAAAICKWLEVVDSKPAFHGQKTYHFHVCRNLSRLRPEGRDLWAGQHHGVDRRCHA